MAQSFLNTLNAKLPPPKYKPLLRATGIPIVGANGINMMCSLAARSPNWVSVYHRYSKFFFPQLTRDAQMARLKVNKSVSVTSIMNSTQDPSFYSIQDDEYFLRGLRVDDDEHLIYLQKVVKENNGAEGDEDENEFEEDGETHIRPKNIKIHHGTTTIEQNSVNGVTTIRSDAGASSDESKARRRELLSVMRDDPATTKTTFVREKLMTTTPTSSSSNENNYNNNDNTKGNDGSTNNNTNELNEHLQLRRDLATYDILFPFADCIDGCARGRAGIGISQIHGRGLFATAKIPKGSVVICVKVMDFVDPVGMMIMSKSPRSLPTLWRYYSPTSGAAFPAPISANATHFLNHSCDPSLRAGFFYPLDSKKIQDYRNRLESLKMDERVDPEKLNERKNSFERNVDGIFGSDVLGTKTNLFVKDPTAWLDYALKKGGGTAGDFDAADSMFEPPLLKSLSDEEVREYKKNEKPFGVDWNCFVAARDIEPNEELTYDYARHLAPSHASEFLRTSSASPCNCGSKYCTGDLYRSVPTKLDLVSSHAERVRLCKPYFTSTAKLSPKTNADAVDNGKEDEDEGEPKIKSMSQFMDDKYDENYFLDHQERKENIINDKSKIDCEGMSQPTEAASLSKSKTHKLTKDEEQLELLLSGTRDPHDDDLVRASFIRNRTELIDKMHRTLPRTMMFRGPVVSNSNLTCQYLTSVMSKEEIVLPMGSTVGELH